MTTRALLSTTVALVLLVGCGDSDPVALPVVDEVDIDPPQVSLAVGDTVRLTARPRTATGQMLSGVDVAWGSQSPEVATVVPRAIQGRVTAVRAGTALITATAGGKMGLASIAVVNPAPSAQALEPSTVGAGGDGLLLVVLGAGFVADTRVLWNGGERPTTYVGVTELRASILAADVMWAGTAEVRVASPSPGGGTSEALTFTITEPTPPPPGPVAFVEIDADSLALPEGDVAQLTATARDASGQVVTGRFVGWTSSDPEVAQAGALGAITAIRAGTVSVTARVDGISTSIPVRVWADYAYDLVYSGWNGIDEATMRLYRTDLGDATRTAVRFGPDAPSGDAAPSPDGSRLAYQLLLGGGARALVVANMDGSGAVELHRTTDVGCGRLAWSPDGQRLAFACRIGDLDRDIWVVDAEGQNMVNLTDAHSGHQDWPSWSPRLADGSYRIAYGQYVNGEPRIWTMKDDGSDPRQITSGIDWQPAWSPDGTTIVFQRTGAAIFGDLWLVDADGGNERGLVGVHLAGPQDSPAWSPDGRFVAFGSTHETYGSGTTLVRQLYTVWADGSRLARRTGGDMPVGGPAWRTR